MDRSLKLAYFLDVKRRLIEFIVIRDPIVSRIVNSIVTYSVHTTRCSSLQRTLLYLFRKLLQLILSIVANNSSKISTSICVFDFINITKSVLLRKHSTKQGWRTVTGPTVRILQKLKKRRAIKGLGFACKILTAYHLQLFPTNV